MMSTTFSFKLLQIGCLTIESNYISIGLVLLEYPPPPTPPTPHPPPSTHTHQKELPAKKPALLGLEEYNEMKEEIKNAKNNVEYTI